MKNRVHDTRAKQGETIVETLAAILIVSLSCSILLTSVSASVHINQQAQIKESEFQKELSDAECGSAAEPADKTSYTGVSPSEKEHITIRVSGSGTTTYFYKVNYTGGDGKLTSYQLLEEEFPTDSAEGEGGG